MVFLAQITQASHSIAELKAPMVAYYAFSFRWFSQLLMEGGFTLRGKPWPKFVDGLAKVITEVGQVWNCSSLATLFLPTDLLPKQSSIVVKSREVSLG